MIDSVMLDVRYAVRQLGRGPALAIAVIATLAVAIGASAALLSLLNAVVFRPLPVREPNRLVLVSLSDRRGQTSRLIAYTTFAELTARQQVFEALALYSGGGVFPLEARGRLVEGNIATVTPDLFPMLGVRAHLGRLITPEDAPGSGEPARVVVLGYRMWQRLFDGDPRAIGERVLIDRAPVTIVGVMTPDFPGLHVDTGSDFYIPVTLSRLLQGDPNRPVRAYNIVARLRQAVTLDHARAVLTAAWPALAAHTLPPGLDAAERDDVLAQRVNVEPMAQGISTSLRPRYAMPLVVLVGLAGVLLFIGCANLSGLLLVRAVSREQQLAVCLALGATRTRVVRQSLIESLLLSVAGTLIAVPLAWAASRAMGTVLWTGGNLPLGMSLTPDARVLGVMAVVTIVTALIIAVLPAIAAARNEPLQALQHGRTIAASSGRTARVLLVAQVALSIVLLFGAGLFTSSLGKLRAVDSGFQPDGLLFARALRAPGPPRTFDERAYYPALVERVSAMPGVRSVALSRLFPSYFNIATAPTQGIGRAEETDRTRDVDGMAEAISPHFFETVGASIVRGRDFTWADRGDSPPVAIINQSLERKLFPNGDAIGKRIRIGTDSRSQAAEVVGVAGDVTTGNLRAPHGPAVFRPAMQQPPASMRGPVVLVRASGDIGAVAAAVPPIVQSFGNEYVRRMMPMDEYVANALQQERILAGLSSFFAGLAAVLTFVGLYGLLAHAVTRRTREIGVRMAIGASRASVLCLIVREALGLTVVGVLLGVPCALAASGLIGALLYGLEPSDPMILAVAAALFLVIGGLAGLLPARRASSIDPMLALRSE